MGSSGRAPSSRLPRFAVLAVAVAALVLYLATLSPTINFLDSGELTTVAWTLGIAHPPGYPLYTLISSLFIHVIPFGSPAWRMNLLSALFAALAVALFAGLVVATLGDEAPLTPAATPRGPGRSTAAATPASRERRATGRRRGRPASGAGASAGPPPTPALDEGAWAVGATAGAAAAAGLLATSLTFWNWATQAKMYSLHMLFVAALFWLALRARRALAAEAVAHALLPARWPPIAWPQGVRTMHLLAMVTGLSITNHLLTVLLLPGLAVLLVAPARMGRLVWPARRVVRHLPTLLAAGLAPLALYLYLPLRASAHPFMNWGSPDSWGDFWRHVTVWQFRSTIGEDASTLPTHLGDALIYAANQFGPWLGAALLLLVAWGLVYLWRVDRALLVATALTTLIDVGYTLNYQIREVVVYYVPGYMILLWWAGLGVAQLAMLLRARISLPRLPRVRPVVVLAPGLLPPLLALALNVGAAGHRDDATAELYVRNAFRTMRPHAVVLTNSWDLVSGAYYLQRVQHHRTDVAVIDEDLLRYPFYVDHVAREYPDVVAAIGSTYTAFRALDRRWVDGASLTSADVGRLESLYQGVLNGILDGQRGRRPAYLIYVQSGQEEQSVMSAHNADLIPEGLGFRIAASPTDRGTGDPRWDLRGLTTHRVPLDEVAYSVVWLYPQALQNIGVYLSQPGRSTDQRRLGARVLAEAQALAPLAANPNEEPRLR